MFRIHSFSHFLFFQKHNTRIQKLANLLTSWSILVNLSFDTSQKREKRKGVVICHSNSDSTGDWMKSMKTYLSFYTLYFDKFFLHPNKILPVS